MEIVSSTPNTGQKAKRYQKSARKHPARRSRLPEPQIQRIDDIVQAFVGRRRFLVSLLSIFSLLAIALSALGL